MLQVSVQKITPVRTSLGYFAISEKNGSPKTGRGYKHSSGRKRYPSPVLTSVAISCCASSKRQPFLKEQHAARASSTCILQKIQFSSASKQIAPLTREKQSDNLQQYNSSVQTDSPPWTNTCRECTSSRRQPSLNRQHPLQEQGRLRAGYETRTESYVVLLHCLQQYKGYTINLAYHNAVVEEGWAGHEDGA